MDLSGVGVRVKLSTELQGNHRTMKYKNVWLTALLLALTAAGLHAQQRGRGARAAPQQPPRQAAPADLTGYWVSLVTEDWRWRMMTPKKGDYTGIPINAEGRRVADSWDPAKDEAAGEQCKAYGAPAIMRVPGRLHITWENDTTLRMDTDAGTQTRLFRFGQQPPPSGQSSWQGHSVAQWELEGGQFGIPRGGHLKVVTTGLRSGYVRKNGVPYSEKGVLTEYFYRLNEPNGDALLFVVTNFEDPQYFDLPLVMTTQFKKIPDGSGWNPTPCSAR